MKSSIYYVIIFTLLFFVQPIASSSASSNELKAQSNEDECSIDPSSNVIVVPSQAKSIQEAIDRLTDKGTVLVRRGTFRENIAIPSNKKIIMLGAGAKKTKILPIDKLKTTISIGPQANVCITGFTIKGGNTGIKAGEFLKNEKNKVILGNPAKSIVIQHINIESASNGLLLNAEKVILDKGKITKNLKFGAYISSPLVEITGTDITSNSGLGIVLMNGISFECHPLDESYTANISDVDISSNNGPGLTFCGPSDVTVTDSFFEGNKLANIQILDQSSGSSFITNNNIYSAIKPDDNVGAHGILAYNSNDINITNNNFLYNETTGVFLNNSFGEVYENFFVENIGGVSFQDSDGEIENNLFLNNIIGVNIIGDSQPEISESNVFIGNVRNIDSTAVPLPPPLDISEPSEG